MLASETFTIVALGYTIVESVTSVNEGGSVTFTFTGPDGTYYYWIDPNTGITSSDFSSGWSVIRGAEFRLLYREPRDRSL